MNRKAFQKPLNACQTTSLLQNFIPIGLIKVLLIFLFSYLKQHLNSFWNYSVKCTSRIYSWTLNIQYIFKKSFSVYTTKSDYITLLMITVFDNFADDNLRFVKTDLDPLVHILTENLKMLLHGFIIITWL